jgi:aspartyl-tRNA(Asn)/glutamyl-tRNA(Gln) amidotransferase subunit B
MPEVVIGLETHVQLATRSKLFCKCSIENIGSAEPNTRVCEVCLGYPGSKPVVNKKAIEYAVKIALALNCKINKRFFFSRKTYFYPDMAKNYQITQYEIPVGQDGYIYVGDKKVRIRRVHIEEDPARIVHVGGDITTAKYTLVDYNRSGIPLVEIVTEPDIGSPREAREYLKTLYLILDYLGVIPKGEVVMKTDANISIKGYARVEVKNITGFKEVERALNYEILRQKRLIESGIEIKRETRAWDESSGVTKPLRRKEWEEDYGYIFDPDLCIVELNDEEIERIKTSLPELPQEKYEKYLRMGINREVARMLSSDLQLATFFEDVVKHVDVQDVLHWIVVLRKILNYNDVLLSETRITKDVFLRVVKAYVSGAVSDRAAELILREVVFSPEKVEELIEEYRIEGEDRIRDVVKKVVKEYEKAVSDYLSGRKEAINFLVGMVMKELKGRADPRKVRELLEVEINDRGNS